MAKPEMEIATLGGGCFWCLEAIYQRVQGVSQVVSGYAGGEKEPHSDREVYSGKTNHAEVVQITYDPTVISYSTLLDIFWEIHDPTTLNRQGYDVGSQYRSIIFFHDAKQKEIAEMSIELLEKSDKYDDPIVTQLEPFDKFYPAANYHQDFYNQNPNVGYCRVIIDPKLQKFLKEFPDHVKT